jgi:hypothetical protein
VQVVLETLVEVSVRVVDVLVLCKVLVDVCLSVQKSQVRSHQPAKTHVGQYNTLQ